MASLGAALVLAVGIWLVIQSNNELLDKLPSAQRGINSQSPAQQKSLHADRKRNALPPAPAPDRDSRRGGLAEALNAIRDEPDVMQREERLARLASRIALPDLPATLASLQVGTGSELAWDLSRRLVQRWAENDPPAAADWIRQNSVGPGREPAIKIVAAAWANMDLPAAVGWLQQLNEGERLSGLVSIAYEAARAEPMVALELAMELPAAEVRNDLITHTASQWAANTPEAAAEWGQQIADDELRDRVLAGIAIVWGEADPVAAATLALEWVTQGRQQDDAVVGIVQHWTQNDPQKAAEWVAAFPEGILRDTAMENVIKLWTDQSIEQVGKWLNGVGSGPARDLAIEAYVGKLLLSSPQSAAQWAESIANETRRHRGMETVGAGWIESDDPGARAWIAQASLPATIKTRLLGRPVPGL